jgi:hypothetical protein
MATVKVNIYVQRGDAVSWKTVANITDIHYTFSCEGRESSVGIVIRYGLDGLGIESRWGQNFPHSSRPALGSTQPPIPGLSRG